MMQKRCKQCDGTFSISERDLEFYQLISRGLNLAEQIVIPPPTRCPSCRQQRRLGWRNERTLYRRKSDATGVSIVSVYAPGTPYKIYEREEWYSDRCDPLAYGRDFDFGRPFFDQFAELQKQVPLLALAHYVGNENSEYTNLVSDNKNCYLIFAATGNEDCFYCTYAQRSRDVVDCFFVFDSEQCYECVGCHNGYNLRFSNNCQNCRDSEHLYNCRSCSNCFGCVSVVNGEYQLFNEALGKELYTRKVAELRARSDFPQYMQERMLELTGRSPAKYYNGFSNENVTGDHIVNSKNCENCFDCTHLEDCSYCTWLHRGTNCYDCYAWGLKAELGYENHLCGNNFYNVQFSECCWNDVSNLLYCRYCTNRSQNLFGCIGLKGKEFCILNKQYTEQEYRALVPKIIRQMEKTGEWGEFFPIQCSPFAYNETVAAEYFPLSKEEVLKRGWSWRDDLPFTTGKETIDWNGVPTQISAISDSILSEVLACQQCDKNYKITAPELKFYRKMNLPIPQHCFDCRYKARFAKRNPRQLYERHCEKCGDKLLSTFSLDRPELVYCEGCYLRAVV